MTCNMQQYFLLKKTHTQSKRRVQKPYPIYDQTDCKPYLLRSTYLYSPYKGVYSAGFFHYGYKVSTLYSEAEYNTILYQYPAVSAQPVPGATVLRLSVNTALNWLLNTRLTFTQTLTRIINS